MLGTWAMTCNDCRLRSDLSSSTALLPPSSVRTSFSVEQQVRVLQIWYFTSCECDICKINKQANLPATLPDVAEAFEHLRAAERFQGATPMPSATGQELRLMDYTEIPQLGQATLAELGEWELPRFKQEDQSLLHSISRLTNSTSFFYILYLFLVQGGCSIIFC